MNKMQLWMPVFMIILMTFTIITWNLLPKSPHIITKTDVLLELKSFDSKIIPIDTGWKLEYCDTLTFIGNDRNSKLITLIYNKK